jgi:hypothetical protein
MLTSVQAVDPVLSANVDIGQGEHDEAAFAEKEPAEHLQNRRQKRQCSHGQLRCSVSRSLLSLEALRLAR